MSFNNLDQNIFSQGQALRNRKENPKSTAEERKNFRGRCFAGRRRSGKLTFPCIGPSKGKLLCEVLKKSENTNAFFSNLEGRCETLHEVPRSRPATRFKCSYGHSRYRLRHFEHKSHVSKPCKPVHVSPDLSTFEVSEFFLLVRT